MNQQEHDDGMVKPMYAASFGYFQDYVERDVARLQNDSESDVTAVTGFDDSICLYRVEVDGKICGNHVKRLTFGVNLEWIGAKEGDWVELSEWR